MEDDVDEFSDSYFSKAAVRVFNKIDYWKAGVVLLSSFVELIQTLGGGGVSEDLVGCLRKVDPNRCGSLDLFEFVRWYVDEEVSLEYTEEAECFVDWVGMVIVMDLQ